MLPFIVNDILELHLGGTARMRTAAAINSRVIRFDAIAALFIKRFKVAEKQNIVINESK